MRDETKIIDEDWTEQAAKEKNAASAQAGSESFPKADFAVLVSSLISQTHIFLGDVENPISKKREVNMERAKFTIDLIDVLKEKTRGNVSEEEARLLDGALFDLRMRYVNAGKVR